MSINKLQSNIPGVIGQPIEWTKEGMERSRRNALNALHRELHKYDSPITEDAEFEIIDPKTSVFNVPKIQTRLKELGALEDIDHEEIKPKQP